MADGDKGQATSIASNSLIIALLIATGASFIPRDAPLDNARPTLDEQPFYASGRLGVEARLWEDPFSAVAADAVKPRDINATPAPDAHRTKNGSCSSGDHPALLHCSALVDEVGKLEAQDNSVESKPSEVLALVALVTGGRYPDDIELRRRVRYAVLAGLNREDFRPESPERLDYFSMVLAPAEQSGDSTQTPTKRSPDKFAKPSTVVPYEWFALRRNAPEDSTNKRKYRRVLVLWVDESFLMEGSSAKPVENLKNLLLPLIDRNKSVTKHGNDREQDKRATNGKVSDDFKTRFDIAVIGPQTSQAYDAMAMEEAKNAKNEEREKNGRKMEYPRPDATIRKRQIPLEARGYSIFNRRAHFYSYGATLAWEPLFAGDQQPQKALAFRMTADDGRLAQLLKTELESRGVDFTTDSVALITEWDTPYGRNIVESMEGAFYPESSDERRTNCQPGCFDKVVKLKYLRGMTGDLPPPDKFEGDETSENLKKESPPVQPGKNGAESSTQPFERPDGKSQYDYLRRIEYKLLEIDSIRRRQSSRGLQAIGVLGSDVFDKLLVLRALKKSFPNAIFFTTDYDSALLMHKELSYTRNLLIASGYGDRLPERQQGEIPPFRSFYQTSAFLATQVIVGQRENDETTTLPFDPGAFARVFEVQRTGELLEFPSASGACNPCATNAEPPHLYPLFVRARTQLLGWSMLLLGAACLCYYGWFAFRQYFGVKTDDPQQKSTFRPRWRRRIHRFAVRRRRRNNPPVE